MNKIRNVESKMKWKWNSLSKSKGIRHALPWRCHLWTLPFANESSSFPEEPNDHFAWMRAITLATRLKRCVCSVALPIDCGQSLLWLLKGPFSGTLSHQRIVGVAFIVFYHYRWKWFPVRGCELSVWHIEWQYVLSTFPPDHRQLANIALSLITNIISHCFGHYQ